MHVCVVCVCNVIRICANEAISFVSVKRKMPKKFSCFIWYQNKFKYVFVPTKLISLMSVKRKMPKSPADRMRGEGGGGGEWAEGAW
jgi:hypothetical protein